MQVLSRVTFVSAIALGLGAFAAIAQDSGRTFTPSELQWKPSPRVPGLEAVNLLGDSAKAGPSPGRHPTSSAMFLYFEGPDGTGNFMFSRRIRCSPPSVLFRAGRLRHGL